MKLKKLGAFAATGAMALALALTGCGSSNATSGSDAGPSSSDDAKVEKVDGSKEYALVKDGTLTVGTSAEYAPFEYKDDNGDYQGFDLELIKAIGDKLGLDVEYVNNDFDTLVPGVASGAKYDVSIAAITDTPEREKEVTFSDSYYMDDQAIVTKVDNHQRIHATMGDYAQADRLPGMVSIYIDGMDSEELIIKLDAAGFEVSAGSACSSGSMDPSHVLSAMGIGREQALGALRISFDDRVNPDDLDEFAQTLLSIVGAA